MRWLLVGAVGVALAGCSRQEPGSAAAGAADLAFQYGYTFRLPSGRIAAAQEQDAARCERLAPPRCRITGMTFNVDGAGEVNASLSVAVAAPLARGFGRDGVAAIEQAGGALIGADISGKDAAAEASDATDATVGTGVATTPVFFTYRAGQGVGAAATLAAAGATAYASLLTTLSVFLNSLAALGPPALLLIGLFLLWRRFGRPIRARLTPA